MNPELSKDAYDSLADAYASIVDTKPHNAYLDKPAVLDLCGNWEGKRILEIGCGTGSYLKIFLKSKTKVVGIEPNVHMLRHAKLLQCQDLLLLHGNVEDGMPYLKDESFDLVVVALVASYIRNFDESLFEIASKMICGGTLVLSTTHPFYDFNYFKVGNYFQQKKVGCNWQGFGEKVWVPQIYRSMQDLINPIIKAGLRLEEIVEPKPTEEFQKSDPERYERLMKFPAFIAIKARKS